MEEKLIKAHASGQLEGLHSVLALRHGETLSEAYFPGEDQKWGQAAGIRNHGPETLHDLRSITKSIVSLLYGIALADGAVPDPDTPILASFPEYPDLARDPVRNAITLGDALTMRMGTEWSEQLPYTDPRNNEIAMEMAADRYRYILERPIVTEPGTTWTYNGGATAIIARLIRIGTGMPIDDFARKRLFAPLGITDFEWPCGRDGEPSAASGLRLTARDLARIGHLVLNHGVWDGQTIVPKDWMAASLTPHTEADQLRYGQFWWLAPEGTPPHWVAGFGNGGQRLWLHPRLGIVLVIFAGNYNKPDAWRLPVRIITDFLLPEVRR